MVKYCFQALNPPPSIPIFTQSSEKDTTLSPSSPMFKDTGIYFPVNRIFCVARNYRDHAIEMGHDPDREPPFFFMKPADATLNTNENGAGEDEEVCSMDYPLMTENLHYEGELVVAIKGKEELEESKDQAQVPGRNIQIENAKDYIYGFALACDLTKRDLQSQAKSKGRPWESAKAFEHSCPIAPIVQLDIDEVYKSIRLQTHVNDELKQDASLDQMTWNIEETISHLSKLFTLKSGDIILTGTPAGVGAIKAKDAVKISCANNTLPSCRFQII